MAVKIMFKIIPGRVQINRGRATIVKKCLSWAEKQRNGDSLYITRGKDKRGEVMSH